MSEKTTKANFREAATWYCPRGCQSYTTIDQNPECGGCGSIMSTDRESYDDVIEAIERAGIARIEREMKAQGPKS
jgi:hypothetical protein